MRFRENKFNQALHMLHRNRKTFLRLMVSIILTFSFLFTVFIFIDSTSYNRTKSVFSQPSYIVTIGIPGHIDRGGVEFQNFLIAVSGVRDTRIMPVQRYSLGDLPRLKNIIQYMNYNYHFYPKAFGEIIMNSEVVKLSDSSNEFNTLNSVYVTTQSRPLLEKSGVIRNGAIQLFLPDQDGKWEFKDWEVQSTVELNEVYPQMQVVSGKLSGNLDVFIPNDLIDMEAFGEGLQEQFVIFTPFAEDIMNLAYRFNFEASTPAQQQIRARADMRQNIKLKQILGSLIFIVLAINLQGSFSNALKERRYEIALRRALGATPKDIVIQFFLESSLVMGAGAVLSLFFVIDGFLLYRLYLYYTQKEVFTIFLSLSSMMSLLAMCISLLLLTGLSFSLSAMATKIVSALQGAGEN